MSQPKLLPDHYTVLDAFNRWFTPSKTERNMCYLCDGDIAPGSHISMYHSDANLAEGTDSPLDGWWAHRVYCEDCKETKIVCPHGGTTEALYEAYTTDEGPIDGYGIADHSLAPDGIPWNPEAILETVSGIPLDKFTAPFVEEGESVGHVAVVDFLRRNGIDIRTLVDEDGRVQVTSDEKAALQDRVNRDALRDHLES